MKSLDEAILIYKMEHGREEEVLDSMRRSMCLREEILHNPVIWEYVNVLRQSLKRMAEQEPVPTSVEDRENVQMNLWLLSAFANGVIVGIEMEKQDL